MPPTCEHQNPDLPITCELDYGHKGDHQRTLESTGVLKWAQEVREQTYTTKQIVSMMDQQAEKLQVTLDAAGDGSRESDALKTFLPIFQEQLFLMRQVLKKVKSD